MKGFVDAMLRVSMATEEIPAPDPAIIEKGVDFHVEIAAAAAGLLLIDPALRLC